MVYDNFYVHIVHKHRLMMNKQHNEVSNEHVEFYLNLKLVPKSKEIEYRKKSVSSIFFFRTILT